MLRSTVPGRFSWQRRGFPLVQSTRCFHAAVGKLTTIGAKGLPTSQETGIMVGDPHETYVYIKPEIGDVLRGAISQQTPTGLTQKPETLPLIFNHQSRCFTYQTLPFPRFEIQQDLPKQSNSETSPATFWLSGNWYSITLDGTPDEFFEREARKTGEKLKGALDLLKDT